MWMSSPPVQVSFTMVVLMMVVWSPGSVSVVSTYNSDEMTDEGVEPSKGHLTDYPSAAYQSRQSSVIKLEVVAIIGDSSNASLALSKSLARTLNSVTSAETQDSPFSPSSPESRNKIVTWRVKNFVIANYSQQQVQKSSNSSNKKFGGAGGSSDYYESGGGGHSGSSSSSSKKEDGKDPSSFSTSSSSEQPDNSIVFNPSVMPSLCEFLSKSNKAVAIVNLIGDVGSERLLSLVSVSTALPLIGSSQYGNPLQTLHKDREDFYINLSTSVRHFARALGHLLIYCHWHSFAVLFDDSPSILTSQLIWEQELSQMKTTTHRNFHSDLSNANLSDYDYEELGGMTPFDEEEDQPVLNPNFITLRTRSSNSAFRALSELTKATQGVVVLLCSERSLISVFRAAKQLRMLNGDYVFILVGQYTKFEVIPEWIPSGVLALRSPGTALVGKHTMKTTGKLLASAIHTVKNTPVQKPSSKSSSSAPKPTTNHHHNNNNNNHQNQLGGVFSGFSSTDFMGAIKTSSSSSSSGSSHGNHYSHPFLSNLDPTTTTSTSTAQNSRPTRPVATFSSSKAQYPPPPTTILDILETLPNISCWQETTGFQSRKFVSIALTREIRSQMSLTSRPAVPIPMTFDILNLVRAGVNADWNRVGNVSPETTQVQLETIRWPGGGIFGPGERPSKAYRIVTIVAPPFVMEVEAEDNRTCVKGLPCLKVNTYNKDEIALIFADFESRKSSGSSYRLACCDGLAMDLLSSVARELKFEIDLFLVPDGYFGSRSSGGQWNGLMSALLSGAAHMSFSPFSVTSIRASSIEFSTPFFFSGVGLLGVSRERDVPLLAFLAPFSPELWVAIFITLNVTALVVALYEWFSPFGLNPWGRQRTKNFSMASALWVVWGRLFSHLVAFKAPKSWPNKFLINVWGGFSVIFVASYTANIAALFAGMFFERAVDVNDRSLLSQRVAAVKHSATDFYIKRENPHLWEHIQKFPVHSFQQGVDMLKNGTLDLLIGDGPLLDYYRGTDSSCSLIDVSDHDKIGDDTYAVAMTKGFPLKESISSLIAKYIGNGYMDYLQGKWYGQMACYINSHQLGARALGVDAVAGMFIMLGVGMIVGLLILLLELIVYKYALPYFRAQPRGTLWRSPNLMFFSQKLYRFINCVELVSPHHAAKELVNTLRHGQITSLFQKSVKRKEHEQRRRRKSKAQFFEMIQEIRRVQKAERQQSLQQEDSLDLDDNSSSTIYSIQGRIPLESNKQVMPKVVRVLGDHAEIYQNKTTVMGATSSSMLPTSPTILEVPEELFPDVDMLSLPPPPPGYRNSPEDTKTYSIAPKSSLADNNKSKDKKTAVKKKIKFKKEPCSSTSLFSRRKSFEDPAAAEEGIAHRQYYHYRKKKQKDRVRRMPEGSSDEIFDDDFEEEDLNLAIYGGDSTEESVEDMADFYPEEGAVEQSNFNEMSKSQVIELWRSSEMDLRRKLAQAIQEKEQLAEKLEIVVKPEILDPP